jgi:hypothetical protein
MPTEHLEKAHKPTFIAPTIAEEKGEIKRVSIELFGNPDAQETENFFLCFSAVARTAQLVELSEDMWKQLENTDSYNISLDDWSLVEKRAALGHSDQPRDWQLLKIQFEQGASIEAPIVLKTNSILHLVSGNTRLMVARALGITPKVLLVKFDGKWCDGAPLR